MILLFCCLSFADTPDHPLHVFFGEGMVHGEADDGVCHAVGVGQVFLAGGGESAVGGELADERVEIASAEDFLAAHLEVELVAGDAVLLGVDEDGEVAVVMAHAGHVVPEGDAGHGAERLAVAYGHLVAGLDGLVHLAEVQQSVGGAHLVHLGVDARCDDLGLAGEAEVLEVVDTAFGLLVVHHHGAALDGVVHLRGMEAERGHVAGVENALAVHLHAEGMGCVVNDLEPVFVGNVLDLLRLARLTVDMHGHDGGGLRRDGGLDAVGVDIAGGGVDVHEDGPYAVPPKGVGRGYEGVGGSDDLPGNAQRLEGGDEREGSVGEKAHVGHFEVVRQGSL